MAKMTKKYTAAMGVFERLGLQQSLPNPYSSEAVYQNLVELGWQWDSGKGKWIKLAAQPARPATALTRIRVWAAGDAVQAAANQVLEAMTERGYLLVEMSNPYPCRPPQQNESRVYITLAKVTA